MFKINREEAVGRPVMTYKQIYEYRPEEFFADPYQSCLMEAEEFLKLFAHLHQFKVSRRNLQLYSSPAYQFIPLPIHKGGYKAYYLNPEHTEALAVAMTLQHKLFFPVQAIQKVMKDYPTEHYRYILQGTLKGEDILESAFLVKEGFDIKDVLYRQVSRVLDDIEEPYWTAVQKFGKADNEACENYVDRELIREAGRLAAWIKAGGRRRTEMASGNRRPEASSEYHDLYIALRDRKSQLRAGGVSSGKRSGERAGRAA